MKVVLGKMSLIIKIISFLLFYNLLIRNQSFSQNNTAIGKVTISSPNAASLGKYGDIPIGLHTGIPNINIPIYTIRSGSLELPVNLSYHASGLKVQEQASWVGAGWTLNAGGVITRTVVGAPDDRGLYGYSTDKGHFSDYGYNSYLFSAGPVDCDPNPNGNGPAFCPPGSNYAPQDTYIQSGKLDGEPDLYFFNFNGHSGKFYFNDDRTPVIVPEEDFKIVPIYPGNDWRGITGFIIRTTDGIQYYFGKNQNNDSNPDAIEVTYNATTQNTYTGQGATSAWYLNKIVSADGQFSINLDYLHENYSYYTLSMFPIPSQPNPGIGAYNNEYDLDKNFINGVRLSKIRFDNGEVDFNAGNLRQDLSLGSYMGLDDVANTDTALGGRMLGNITIQSTDMCKKYTFSNSYFYDDNSLTGNLFTQAFPNLNLTSDKYRLRLDSIQEISCDNTRNTPPYRFTYFSEPVPRKLSFGIDHWGYYNGVTTNQSLIPTYTVISSGYPVIHSGADRDASWPAMRGGSLQKISYPTGGNSTFDFESNNVFYSTSNYVQGVLTALVVHESGQSQLNHSLSFTINGSGACTFYVNNASTNWSPTFSIKNSNNVEQGSGPWLISVSSSFNQTLLLPPGTYQATLSFPSNSESNLVGGANATVKQWQTVTSQSNATVGGLRIKTVSNNDGVTSIPVITSYGYNYANTSNGHSSGQLISRPTYVQALRNDAWGVVGGASCSTIGCFTCFGSDASYYQSPSSIRPMATTQGNHIGYGEVHVSQTGNGYSVNKYYSSGGSIPHVWDNPISDVCVRTLNVFCDPGIINSPIAPEPFDPMRGELASDEIHNQAGQLISSSSYYPLYQFDSLITPGIISRFFYTGINTFTEYTLQSAKKIRDSVVTTTYDPQTGNYLTNVKASYYKSKYHNSPTQTISISSKGETIATNIKSAFDFRIINYNVADQLADYYSNINNDLSYLSNALSGVTVSPSDAHYYWQRLNIFMNFRYMKAIHRQSYIAYRRQNFTDPSNAYQIAHDASKTGASSDLKPILELQDVYNNASIETTNWKNENLTGASFIKYDYSTNPSNKVYPKIIQKINLSSPSSTFTRAIITGTSITTDSRYQDETSVKYYAGNVVEILPKSGVYTSYIWGYNNNLPVVKAIGVDQTTLQNAYTAASGNLSALRGQASLVNAQIFTYTYSLLNGITSETDASSRTIYYEYDTLGRLKLIRDNDNNIIKKFCYNYSGQPENCN